MAYPVTLPRNYRTYTATLADVSASSAIYIPTVARGRVKSIFCAVTNTVTGTSIMTFSIGSTAITGGSIADVGTAAGTVSSCVPTALNTFEAGTTLKASTNGGSTNASPLGITWVVEEF